MKKETSPAVYWLRRTLLGISVLLKACLLILPILGFMVWFNYTVDSSGLFQGEVEPRNVASMLLNGQTVSNYDKMDERQVLALYVQNLPEDRIPDTLALGSSRVMQLNQDIVGSSSFFNGGLSGASFMDIANTWYLFERAGKLPKNLILTVDPWLFNGDAASDLNRKSDSALFAEFLEKALSIPSDYKEPDPMEIWKALIDPAYFQGNVQYYLKQKKSSAQNSNASDSPFFPVTGDISNLDYAVKFPDGSIQYPVGFRTMNTEQVLNEALGQAGTLSEMHGFSQMDPYWTNLFDQFIQHVQQQGVNVVFLLTPYHPFIALHAHNNPEGLEGFFQVEPWLREYASTHNIPLYGSYHAGRVGIPESLFFDGIHAKGDALRLMFPGIEQAILGQRTAYEEQYLSKYGDQENTKNALMGTDAGCVVIDPEWFASVTQ